MSTTLPPLVDEAALARYLDRHLGGREDVKVERHRAGHSNETFFIERGGVEMVLRRPPLGAFLPTAHDVGREYRVLTALNDADVRTPRTILACDDESVIGAPFYLMERIRGVVIRNELPPAFTIEDRQRIGFEIIDALVELHGVDPASCGLASFGKPEGYLARQLKRWTGQMELTLPLTRPLPELEKLGRWLSDHLPESPRGTIVHGDYKLDNVLFTEDPPARLLALLDWEMSTLGDPLADLGWMISFWREADDDFDDDAFADLHGVTAVEGFPRRDELVGRYAERTGRDTSNLDWYIVLAVWKLAILLEGSYARHLAGMTDDPFFARMEHGVPALARRALEVTAE